MILLFKKAILDNFKFYYRIEKITHKPSSEDVITTVEEVKENDLELGRLKATRILLDNLQELKGKYSPPSSRAYDRKRGRGYNLQLLLIDKEEKQKYLVESTMEDLSTSVKKQQKLEQEIFDHLGLKRPFLFDRTHGN